MKVIELEEMDNNERRYGIIVGTIDFWVKESDQMFQEHFLIRVLNT